MNNFYTMFLTLVFFTSNAFSYHCWFLPYSGDIRVADINGRQVYTLFTPHLVNEPEELNNILNLDIDPNEGLIVLYRFLDKNKDTIDFERSEFQQITSLLTSQEIDWIGVESNPKGIQATEQKAQNYQTAKESFNSVGPWNQETTDDLLYLLHSVWIRLLTEYPNDIVLDGANGIKVIPLEDQNLGMRRVELTIIFNQRFDEVLYDTHITVEQQNALNTFLFNDHMPFDLVESLLLEEFFKTHRIENPELIEKIRVAVDSLNEKIIIDQKRDEFVVQEILKQEGNGLVLRGSTHQENVEGGLTQACLDIRNL